MKMGELKWSELEMKKVRVMMKLRCEKEWERRKRMVLMTLKLTMVLLTLKLMALLALELEALVAEEHLLVEEKGSREGGRWKRRKLSRDSSREEEKASKDAQGVDAGIVRASALGEQIKEKRSRSGWGWDEEKNMPVPPSEDAWDEMIATLKGKSFNFMDQMHIITGTSMARGDLGAGDFGNSYLDQRDERNMDDDDLFLDMNENDGDPNPLDNQQPTLTEDIPPQTTDHGPTPNSTPQTNVTVTQTSTRKKRRFSDSCNDSLEKIAKLGEDRLALQKEALELQKTIAPPVSSALDQLMKVDGIPDHLLYKAIDVMKGFDDWCIFLGLPVSLGIVDLNTAPNLMDEEDHWQEVDDTIILLCSSQVVNGFYGMVVNGFFRMVVSGLYAMVINILYMLHILMAAYVNCHVLVHVCVSILFHATSLTLYAGYR
ncbi:hypothetical protein Taro_019824 [Colocasia esculenta]|uniref:Uncharacterized protein n=1 Tax=Colocasia esculenta TaxID=4460 RepID=A0A843UUK2_COLES|nr:hypothetical protein [Colocasia esculenta]